MMVRLRFLSFIWYLIRFMMFWGAIFFVLVPRGKGESYFFDKYFFAQNDMNRINIWFGLLLDRINYGTLEIFSGHLVLNSVHNISNRGSSFVSFLYLSHSLMCVREGRSQMYQRYFFFADFFSKYIICVTV